MHRDQKLTKLENTHRVQTSANAVCYLKGYQGRNFGLKSGGTNSEGERSILGSRGKRGGEWGGSIPPPHLTPSGVRGGAPAENGFIVI